MGSKSVAWRNHGLHGHAVAPQTGRKKVVFFFRGPKRRKKNIEMTWPSCDIMTASQNRSKSYIGPNRSPKMLQQVLNMSEASKF